MSEVFEMVEISVSSLQWHGIYTDVCTCQNPQNCEMKMIAFNCK